MKPILNRKLETAMFTTRLREKSSVDSVVKLRHLIDELSNEVDSLEERASPLPQTSLLQGHEIIDFYQEVEQFERSLIRRALRQTAGHQIDAARLLNLNPSTLNAKIKQYGMKVVVFGFFLALGTAYQAPAQTNVESPQAQALVYESVGRDREAVKALRQVACLKPNDAKAQCQLGTELNSLGLFQEAAGAIEIDLRFALADDDLVAFTRMHCGLRSCPSV